MTDVKTMRARWVEALRSGKYRQGRNALLTPDGYCCLGVLAKMCGWSDDGISNAGTLDTSDFVDVRAAVGLKNGWGGFIVNMGDHRESSSLAALNDHGSTFAEIADLIESEPEGLFIDVAA